MGSGYLSFSHIQHDDDGALCPPPKVRGDILVSVWVSGVGGDSLYPPYFLNQWVEFYQTSMDTSFAQTKELIKFS